MQMRIPALAVALALAGCASQRTAAPEPDITAAFPNQTVAGGEGSNPDVRYYVQRTAYSFVRVERLEPGAAPNDAPPACKPDATALKEKLGAIVARGALFGDRPLYTGAELDALLPPLIEALGRARPDEDIAIASSARRGQLGRYLGLSTNSARVFVRGGQFNYIAGLVQYGFEQEVRVSGYLRPFTPGARQAPLDKFTELDGAGLARPDAARKDWLSFALPGCAVAQPAAVAPAAAAPAPTPPAPPAVAPRAVDASAAPRPVPAQPAAAPAAPAATDADRIEQRLRTLDRLRERKLISDEEYRDKRRAILDGL
ncbi:SHOCT domain-containing protein [Derxia lacustris]|uniref:SHOCT domain-containing protein n=1 Tax=Derxia lacustris TaxID=764842 RepID=UPI000A176D00|nr:SHOCT domain-containing protein [Derxia lacustris]